MFGLGKKDLERKKKELEQGMEWLMGINKPVEKPIINVIVSNEEYYRLAQIEAERARLLANQPPPGSTLTMPPNVFSSTPNGFLPPMPRPVIESIYGTVEYRTGVEPVTPVKPVKKTKLTGKDSEYDKVEVALNAYKKATQLPFKPGDGWREAWNRLTEAMGSLPVHKTIELLEHGLYAAKENEKKSSTESALTEVMESIVAQAIADTKEKPKSE